MRIISVFALIFAFSATLTAEFIKVPTKDKFKEKDLLFAATFDNFTLNANFAKGNPRSTTLPDTQLMLRGSIGFDGQQAYRPIAGESLCFDAFGNADPHEGTFSIWYRGIDWSPSTIKTNGKSRGNIVFANMKFVEKSRFIDFHLYQYEDTVYFDWWSSEPPHGWGTYGRIPTSIRRVKANEWIQLVITWKDNKISLYVNGEFARTSVLPGKYTKTADLKPEKGKSVIGIKAPYHGDKHAWLTEVDDVFIYSRAMTANEIRNRYLKLKKGGAKDILPYEISLSGVDTGDGKKCDKMEALLDFSSLPDADMKLLEKGKLTADWKLVSPSGKTSSGKWTFKNIQESRMFTVANEPGNWKLETRIGKLNPVSTQIYQPDLSYIGNKIGDNVIPALWKDFACNTAKRTITLWNRVYDFKKAPLPQSIKVKGRELLKSAPKLLVNGKEPVWTPGKITKDAISYTFESTGKINGGELIARTRVEYDGIIIFDFDVKGKPEISSMELDWQVNKEFCQFLMTPQLFQQKNGKLETSYPVKGSGSRYKQLWFVSEKIGGFCFSMPHDANWRYKDNENILFADRNTGKCRVTPVTYKSVIPEGANYRFFFIATPTRPLPELKRVIRMSDYGNPGAKFFDGCSCQGQKNTNTFEPHPTDFEFYCRPLPKLSKAMYGCADSLADDSPVGLYFKRYWDIPGASSYKMPHRPKGRYQATSTLYNSLPGCAATSYSDYILNNQRKVFEHPYGDRIWMIYYDLCGNNQCGNPLHGHLFKDSFGREITTFCLEAKRNLVRRTVAQAHKYGRVVMLHAQRDFNPMLHGMADYWFPGEQHQGLIMNSPFGYTDMIPDELYRSEYNRDVLGTGVIFLPVIGYLKNGYRPESEKYVMGMLSMLQLHDIDSCGECIPSGPWIKLVNILSKYNLGQKSVQCFKYYEPGLNVKSSNPDVRVTRYVAPDNRQILFLSNKEMRSREAIIDISAISKGDFNALEEWQEKTVPVKDGKFKIRIPARSFRIVALAPVPTYPIHEKMDKMFSIWKAIGSDVLHDHDEKVGCSAAPSLRMTIGESGKGGAFTRAVMIKPGRTYTVKLKAKSENAKQFTISLQFAHGMTNLKKAYPVIKKFKPSKDWTELTLTYKIPSSENWKTADRMVIVFSSSGKNSVAWFDDLIIEEKL